MDIFSDWHFESSAASFWGTAFTVYAGVAKRPSLLMHPTCVDAQGYQTRSAYTLGLLTQETFNPSDQTPEFSFATSAGGLRWLCTTSSGGRCLPGRWKTSIRFTYLVRNGRGPWMTGEGKSGPKFIELKGQTALFTLRKGKWQ